MSSPPIIEVHSLRRRDPVSGRMILEDVELSIQAGECIGVIGPTGSGKSTLLRAIALLDPWNDGELLFHGDPMFGDQIPSFRRSVVYVSQTPVIVQKTLREELRHVFRFGSATSGLQESDVESQLMSLDQPVGLLDQPVEQLSGGEMQIAALLRALSLFPQVLLLDEPTASLDTAATAKVEAAMAQWRASGQQRAVVWVSHDQQQVQRIATRVIELKNGQILSPDTSTKRKRVDFS